MLDLVPTETVDGWLSEHSEIDATLIQSIVDDIERIAREAEENFHRDQIVHPGNPEIESLGYSDEVIEYMGLDDRTWALEYIFGTYIPNLHRRSGLMAIFAHFEGRIEKLCCLYEGELQLESSYTNCKGGGVQRCSRYLRNIVELPIEPESDTWTNVYQIRDVRNLVAHCQADLTRTSEPKRNRIKQIVATSPELEEKGELIMLPGYLGNVVETFSSLYFEIGEAESQRRKH